MANITKRKRRGIRMESALAIGGSRLSPVPGPEAFPPDQDPPGELPQPDAWANALKRAPGDTPAPKPTRAASPKRAGGMREASRPPRSTPAHRRVAEGRVTEAPAPVAPERVVPAAAKPAPARSAPARSVSVKPVPAKPPVSGRRVRRQRQVVIAAVAGFLAGLLVYRAFAPHEAPAPERPAPAQRAPAPEWPPAPPFSPVPESSWPTSPGRMGPDSSYRPPAYPGGPSYPTEDYRPWGRTDGRSERPRETPPASSGGYPASTSPYAPYVPAR